MIGQRWKWKGISCVIEKDRPVWWTFYSTERLFCSSQNRHKAQTNNEILQPAYHITNAPLFNVDLDSYFHVVSFKYTWE